MFAIKQVPVIKSPSNCTVPTEDSWLQTDFTPVPSGRISLNLFFTNLVCCSPCCDKQLQITYSIALGTAPRLSQHSNPCRHSPNSSLPCRHNGNCWGFPNTRAPPMHAHELPLATKGHLNHLTTQHTGKLLNHGSSTLQTWVRLSHSWGSQQDSSFSLQKHLYLCRTVAV